MLVFVACIYKSYLDKKLKSHPFFTRCLLLAPGRSPATKKSPALPLLKKKHRRKLSWTCARSARCTVRSKLYVHIIIVLFALCAYVALPEFCGCNLNKLEGQKFLYLLAVHINELFKSAIKWDKPLCSSFLLLVLMSKNVVIAHSCQKGMAIH